MLGVVVCCFEADSFFCVSRLVVLFRVCVGIFSLTSVFFCVFDCAALQVTNTGGEEYRRWERGMDRVLDDMENKRYYTSLAYYHIIM